MEILVCGTAAAEGWPALFCHCGPCADARRLGGKNLRSRSAYQIDQRIRIDFGPDSNLHQQKYGLAFDKLEHLLMSHSHWDHWTPQDIAMRRRGFAVVPDDAILQVYGNEKVHAKLMDAIHSTLEAQFLKFHPIELWQSIVLCDGIVATPLKAAHDRSELCVNWLLEQNGRRFLQGHDTGWWDDDTWEFLASHPINLAVIDCTYGKIDSTSGHLGCANVVAVRDRLKETGALAPDARLIATHFSHNGAWLHHELEAYFSPHGIEVAFDGMKLEL